MIDEANQIEVGPLSDLHVRISQQLVVGDDPLDCHSLHSYYYNINQSI